MTTSPISPVLPASPRSAGVQRSGDSPDSHASTGSFSSVLARQNGNSPAKPADGGAARGEPTTNAATPGVTTPGVATPDTMEHRHGKDKPAKREGDEASLAELAAEQGLSLPQLALSIAAEVAAVQRNGATANGLAASTLQKDASQAARNTAEPRLSRPASAVTAANARAAATSAAAARADTQTEQSLALPRGFLPAQAADGNDSTTNLNALALGSAGSVQGAPMAPGRAASIAGAKQAVLAMQARAQAAGAARDATSLPEFITLANGAAVAGSAGAHADTGLVSPAGETALGQLGALAGAHAAADNNQAASLGKSSLLMGASGQAASSVATPLNSPQWASDFGRQFVSMAQGAPNMPHTAELRLDPPELGPLRISINIVDNVAHAVFVSAHAAVRQTLENSLPQLHQLLAQAGISLGQTSVSDQGLPQQAFGDDGGSNQGRRAAQATVSGTGGTDTSASSLRNASRSPAPDALVDTFA